MKVLKNMSKINKIFLMLGEKCNLQCKYCLQHDLVKQCSAEIDENVMNFIRSKIVDYRRLKIIFYGGEPLVYWNTIKYVVTHLSGNVSFGIITNGKLLDEKKIDFINDFDISVTLSWDGKNVLQTRGYDVLKENISVLQVNKLSLSCVLSKYTYPLDFLNEAEQFMKAYRMIHQRNLGLNIDTIMDFGNCSELRQMDLDKIKSQVEYIIKHKTDKIAYYTIVEQLESKYLFYKKYVDKRCRCSNGYSVWNVDLKGNIYRCHNSGEKIGTINNSEKIVIDKANKLDPTFNNYQNKCKDCFVQPLCRSGCPLIDEKGRNDYYCDIKNAYYSAFIEDVDKPTEIGRVINIE